MPVLRVLLLCVATLTTSQEPEGVSVEWTKCMEALRGVFSRDYSVMQGKRGAAALRYPAARLTLPPRTPLKPGAGEALHRSQDPREYPPAYFERIEAVLKTLSYLP